MMATLRSAVATGLFMNGAEICILSLSRRSLSGLHGLEGLKHMPTAIVPGIYDPTLADDNLWIETEDAYRMTRWLGAMKACWWACRSGANVHAARGWRGSWSKEGGSGVVVTVLCDGATKYLSEPSGMMQD